MLIDLYKEDLSKITVKFTYSPEKVNKIKEIKGRYWFPDKHIRIIPFTKNSISQLFDLFDKEKIKIDDSFIELKKDIDFSTLKFLFIHFYLHKYKKELKIRGYSPKTIKAYLGHLNRFTMKSDQLIQDIQDTEMKEYILELIDLELSESYVNQGISSLKLFYNIFFNNNVLSLSIPRPKKAKKLPIVLSRNEIDRIIDAIKNYKHKAIICLVYSSGLRVSEVVRLKTKHIDSDRKMLFIKGAKGKKDRYSILSKKALVILRNYVQRYRPKKWLFPGQKEGNHLSERSVQKIFEKTCKKAKINKDATVHTLRHSFAIHLHENGVDIRYIQELLGHKSSKTTEIYTHVSKFDIGKIDSPFDDL